MDLPMPSLLVREAQRGGRQDWLATLPKTVRDLEQRWSLQVGEPYQPGGSTAWVAPVVDLAGEALVLKVAWRHPEADHEADGLRLWDGNGTVRLLAAEETAETTTMLLERCRPGTPLGSAPPEEQDHVISGLLGRLWQQPVVGGPFRPLQVLCDAWADEFERKTSAAPVDLDPALVREGASLFRSLPGSAEGQVLLCTDLHAGNVLAAEREPWLVVDPKPYLGDPTYDLLQHLLNCPDRLRAEPRDFPRRLADLVGVDPERLLLWLFARCVQESVDRPALAEIARQVAPA